MLKNWPTYSLMNSGEPDLCNKMAAREKERRYVVLIYINGPLGILGIQPSTSQFNLQLKMAEKLRWLLRST